MTMVPKALRDERRWITWKHLEGRKPPCDPRDGRALEGWNDPANWVTYDEAVALFAQSEHVNGVGFVLGDGWSGLDLDHCRDPETGDLSPGAEAVLGLCEGAYAEVSPSEEGVKVFGRGGPWLELNFAQDPPGTSRKPSGYFAVTGACLDPGRQDLPELPLDGVEGYFAAASAPQAPQGAKERPLPQEGASVPPGGQEGALFREACALRGRGYTQPEIAQALWGLVQAGRFPPEAGREAWTFSDCQDKARSACRYEAPEKAAVGGDRPTVIVGTNLVQIVDQAVSAVGQCEMVPIYVRARQLVTVVRDGSDPKKWLERPPGQPVIHRINEVMGRELLAVAADWMSSKGSKGELKECMPPMWVSQHLLNRVHWPFPYLESITETPCFLPDGRVLATPGHDEASGVLYEPLSGVEWPEVPESPSLEDAMAAGKALVEPVSDMPFIALSDVAAYVAAILTLIGRMAISSPVPMFPIRAKAPASGKGLLASVIGIVGTGRAPAVTTLCESEELRKRITSIALSGTPLVLLDDVGGSLGSEVLAAALTATTWEDRILGASETVSLPLRAMWLATGNNVGFQRTLGRRVVPIDLDAKMEHPEDRSDFKIPDLLRWVSEHRPQLVASALTILRAYHVAGRPVHGKPRMGSFEAWDDLVRGAVVWIMKGVDPAGAEDLASARGRIRATADDDLADMRSLLEALRERYDTERWTAAHVWDRADTDRGLRLVLDAACPGKGQRPASLQSLRYKVRSLEGRPCGDLTLARTRGDGPRETWWAVLKPGEKDIPPSERGGSKEPAF